MMDASVGAVPTDATAGAREETRRIAGYGWRPDLPDHRDHLFGVEVAPAKLPLKVDLRESGFMPPIYDQGQLGSCTANAAARLVEFDEAKQGLADVSTPSRLFIYYYERLLEGTVDEDSGAELRDAAKVLAKRGVPDESEWPYDIDRFTIDPPTQIDADAFKRRALVYQRIVPGHGRLRSAIASGYPVMFGFSVPESFESGAMASGHDSLLRLPEPGEKIIGGHAVCVVGYDWSKSPRRCLIANSWGADWCRHGYFSMEASWFDHSELASDFWVVRRITDPGPAA
jgi:C1A family cysteine protease